jgi:hypothetical protein
VRRFSLPLKAFCCCFSLQLCGVRGGGEAASQAMFWRPRNDLSLVLAFESTRERNTAIMLARRFAVDCNVRAFAKHHHHQSRSAATFFSSHLNEMVADHPCWARRQNSLVMAPVLLCQSPPLLTIRDSHSLLAPVPLIFLPRQSGLCCAVLCEGAVRTVLTASAPPFHLAVLCFFFSRVGCNLLLGDATVM